MTPNPEAAELLGRLRALLAAPDDTPLQGALEELAAHHLLDLWFELAPEERERVLRQLSPERAAQIVANLSEGEQPGLIQSLAPPVLAELLEELSPDDLADTLQALHASDPAHASEVRSLLEPETLAVADALGRYDEEVAGGLMTTDFVSVRASMTVEQVLEFLRRAHPDAETIYYIYVVDDRSRLRGVLSLRDLIVAPANVRVSEIMRPEVLSIPAHMDQEEVAGAMSDHDFSVLPVVDDQGVLVGIVTVDDVLDVVEEEATEDFHRFGAAPIDIDYVRANPWILAWKRAHWLVLLVVSMTLTFNVISRYEALLEEIVILAAFIPLLIGTGGNVGSQVATLVVRALATRELELGDYLKIFFKETGTGLLLGLAFGIFMTGYVLVLRPDADPRIAVALGITMVLIALTANLVGASMPFLFRRFGIDPALTSSPGITTVMDVVGLLIYFRVVIWVLGPLLGEPGAVGLVGP
jgi:magnesium transporter